MEGKKKKKLLRSHAGHEKPHGLRVHNNKKSHGQKKNKKWPTIIYFFPDDFGLIRSPVIQEKNSHIAKKRYTSRIVANVCFFFFFLAHFHFPASGQAVVTGVIPSPSPILAFIFYRA